MPFDHLLVGSVVAVVARESVGEDEATQWVTTQIRTVGVQFTSTIINGHVNLGLVEYTSDLEVGRSAEELDTLKGTVGNDTSTVAWLGAPCNGLTLSITDGRVELGRAPNTEVWGLNSEIRI